MNWTQIGTIMAKALRRKPQRLGVFALMLWIGIVLLPDQGLAHSQLLAASPADGQVLPHAREVIQLDFSQEVTPIVARLTTPAGETLTLVPQTGTARRLIYDWPEAQHATGSYLVSWRVAAEDGHPMAGGLVISIGHADGAAPATQAQPRLPMLALWLGHAALLAGLFFGVGSRLWWRGSDRPVRGFLALGLGAALVIFLSQPLVLMGEGSGQLFSALWRETAAGIGQWHGLICAIAALILAALLPRLRGAGAWVLCGVIGLLAVGAVVFNSHLTGLDPKALIRAALVLHLGAALFWLGALLPLIGRVSQGDIRLLRRFSSLAPWAVAVLLGSGALLAMVQLGQPSARWISPYGTIFLAKLGLVALMLALAGYNRARLAALAEAGATAPLRRAVLAEIAIGLVVLLVLSLWRFTPPPRLLPPPAQAQLVQMQGQSPSGALIGLTLASDSSHKGRVGLRVIDITKDGRAFSPLEARLSLSKPAFGLGPFSHDLPQGAGASAQPWQIFLPMEGAWVVDATLLLTPFETLTLTDLLQIAP